MPPVSRLLALDPTTSDVLHRHAERYTSRFDTYKGLTVALDIPPEYIQRPLLEEIAQESFTASRHVVAIHPPMGRRHYEESYRFRQKVLPERHHKVECGDQLVALCDEEVVGSFCLSVAEGDAGLISLEVAVEEEYRRKGIGTLLMQMGLALPIDHAFNLFYVTAPAECETFFQRHEFERTRPSGEVVRMYRRVHI